MNKVFILNILMVCFFILRINAQVKGSLFIYDNCKETMIKVDDPFCYNALKLDNYRYDTISFTYVLPFHGKHKLFFIQKMGEYNSIISDSIYVSSSGNSVDTIYLPKLAQCFEIYKFEGYTYCGEICNGYYVDYFKNGNKRLEGNFQKGQPMDYLNFYNINGFLEKEEIYKNGRKRRTEYYNNIGEIIKVEKYFSSRKMRIK